jgi:hypothetical protein
MICPTNLASSRHLSESHTIDTRCKLSLTAPVPPQADGRAFGMIGVKCSINDTVGGVVITFALHSYPSTYTYIIICYRYSTPSLCKLFTSCCGDTYVNVRVQRPYYFCGGALHRTPTLTVATVTKRFSVESKFTHTVGRCVYSMIGLQQTGVVS